MPWSSFFGFFFNIYSLSSLNFPGSVASALSILIRDVLHSGLIIPTALTYLSLVRMRSSVFYL